MDNGMDNILDTYLYESNSLLDQLDEMLVKDEKEGDFSRTKSYMVAYSNLIAGYGRCGPHLVFE